ncbi:sialate O-acetylesterase [Lentisphaera profundi]|uniref:Sialate O-acetylesterase n=1 Tax=Lentisphaera profundi TaxID=1658616 RepID=A0ABY7VXB6_9BACT|nr:sialate O-acetylesterase [Lentisphaera profundi]WDE98885.1 sialate O-acetylesterase [Lentisphaera profundi]
MKQLLAIIIFISTMSVSWGAIELPAVFSDGAVLQCDKELPIWGWGKAGEKVAVSFANQSETSEVKPDGSWMVKLKPIKPSYEKHIILIKVGAESLELKNILVGEVWFCSGQSNMLYTLGAVSNKTKDQGYESVLEYMRKEKDTAKDEFLRHIKVPNVASVLESKRNFTGNWISSAPENNSEFTAVGYFFAKEIRKHLDCPVGLLNCSWGGKRIDPFIPPSQLKSPGYDQMLATIKKQVENYDLKDEQAKLKKALANFKTEGKSAREIRLSQPRMRPSPNSASNTAGAIYNGMTHPLVPYAIRGMLWYQGESHNHSKPATYGGLLKKLIAGLRAEWGQGDFPVYFCQIANLTASSSKPATKKNSWVTISNQQRLSMKIPNTGMAVLNDIGQVKDIHPLNKLDVGKRLSKWALNKTYGFTEIVASGPLYQSSEQKAKSIIIKFDYPGSGLMIGKKHLLEPVKPLNVPLGGFEICGEDKVWTYAEAKIISQNEVEVSHQSIDKPLAVRYAWQQNPANANLYNKEGLPSSLFSTLDSE